MRLARNSLALAAPALVLLAVAPAAHADVKDGVDAWQQGDYQQAVAEWRPLAIAGDPDAQFNLGQAYKLGRGVPTDLAQAEAWYRRAADQGHLQAEDNLGLVLFTANRREDAMPYIRRSAMRGEPRAQYVLGTAHFNGDLAPQDWPLAYALTKRATDAGLSIAAARLAQLDRLIPLEQRQAGLAMLPEIERNEQRARLAAVTAATPPAPVAKPAPAPVRTASLPPSQPGASYTPPPVIARATPVPSAPPPYSPRASIPGPIASADVPPSSAPGTSYEAPEGLEELPPSANIPPPAAAPAAAPPTARPAAPPVEIRPAVAASAWRVQLGAFSSDARAKALWHSLESKFPAFASRQPYLVKSGAITRLQAGDFANKGEADAFCAAVSGQACIVVRK